MGYIGVISCLINYKIYQLGRGDIMKKNWVFRIVAILMVLFAFASYVYAESSSSFLKEIEKNFRKNLQHSKINADVKVEIIKKIDTIPNINNLYLIKLILKYRKTKKERVFYYIADTNYIYRDLIEIKTGKSLYKDLLFYAVKYNVPYDNLSFLFGSKDNKNVVILASDFQCPYCRNAFFYFKEKVENDKLDLSVYILHTPLRFHKKAILMAKIYEAGKIMGHDFSVDLYNRELLKMDNNKIIDRFANRTNAPNKFKELLKSNEVADIIKQHSQLVRKYHINSTPTIFINGHKVTGFNKALIDKALKSNEIIKK